MIQCPNCGKRNSDENKFCGECGTKLPEPENYCPQCEKHFFTGEKFCTQCGTKLVNKERHDLFIQEKERRKKEDEERHRYQMQKKQGLKICPNCGKRILKNAMRCKYCKTILKTYE